MPVERGWPFPMQACRILAAASGFCTPWHRLNAACNPPFIETISFSDGGGKSFVLRDAGLIFYGVKPTCFCVRFCPSPICV